MASPASTTPISSPAVLCPVEEHGPPVVVIIAGPTACGKSDLALAVAEVFAGTVINADSMQVYRDLHLLTARPDSTEMARAPHRLYGVLGGDEICSAVHWLILARAAVAEAHATGRLPIVVGGTGLYLEALQHGLAPVPEIPMTVRTETRALMAAIGPVAFHDRLARRDPAMAVRLRPSDTQRLQRAWEVMEATGRSLADWQRKERGAPVYTRFCSLLLMPPRPVLQVACDSRFRRMVAAGGITEVKSLLARNLPPDRPILKALGVGALTAYLQSYLTLEAAIAAAQGATRRYAKRQCTWFRHHLNDARVVPDQYVPNHPMRAEILSFVRRFLSA